MPLPSGWGSNATRFPLLPLRHGDPRRLTVATRYWPEHAGAGGYPFDNNEAHSADYDATKTAELFCLIVNRWQSLGVGRLRPG